MNCGMASTHVFQACAHIVKMHKNVNIRVEGTMHVKSRSLASLDTIKGLIFWDESGVINCGVASTHVFQACAHIVKSPKNVNIRVEVAVHVKS